jgi:Cof subfamily protein (haloacid dehalogenase superfamily)
MAYKLIALDLDGTLTNSQKKVTPVTRDVLIEAQRRGIRVVLASARPAPGLFRERAALELDRYGGYLMSYNGARIMEAATDKLLFSRDMPAADVHAMLTHLADFPVSVMVDDGSRYYTNDPQGYKVEFERNNIGIPITKVDDLAAAVTFATPKILVLAPRPVLEKYTEAIAEPFRGAFDFFRVDDFYLEIVIKNFSKADGLKALCRATDIPLADVVAFGDSANDVAMLECAGLGVAMCNADDWVCARADRVTSCTNDDDGVARFLESLIF